MLHYLPVEVAREAVLLERAEAALAGDPARRPELREAARGAGRTRVGGCRRARVRGHADGDSREWTGGGMPGVRPAGADVLTLGRGWISCGGPWAISESRQVKVACNWANGQRKHMDMTHLPVGDSAGDGLLKNAKQAYQHLNRLIHVDMCCITCFIKTSETSIFSTHSSIELGVRADKENFMRSLVRSDACSERVDRGGVAVLDLELQSSNKLVNSFRIGKTRQVRTKRMFFYK